MRPNLDLTGVDFMDQAPELVGEELAKVVAEAVVEQGWAKTPEEAAAVSSAFVAFLMRRMPETDEEQFLSAAGANAPMGAASALLAMRSDFDEQYRQAISHARAMIPAY